VFTVPYSLGDLGATLLRYQRCGEKDDAQIDSVGKLAASNSLRDGTALTTACHRGEGWFMMDKVSEARFVVTDVTLVSVMVDVVALPACGRPKRQAGKLYCGG
jgi:hypothetical protein